MHPQLRPNCGQHISFEKLERTEQKKRVFIFPKLLIWGAGWGSPVPLVTGSLAQTIAETVSREQAVFQFVLDTEGLHRGGLIFGTRVLAQEGVGERRLGRQSVHGVEC